MNWISDPRKIKYTPVGARIGFEFANVGFIWRMIETRSSQDQNPWSWLLLFLCLCAWCNFYRVCTPEQKPARVMSIVAALTNLAVLCTVIYFRVR